MGCDYYTQTELVVEYVDENGFIYKTISNINQEKGYVFNIPDANSDDDEETMYNKYDKYIEIIINRNKYIKILYENDEWINPLYENKYKNELLILYPRIYKLVKVYKNHTAWKGIKYI
jgi:hypothetical protein